MDDLKAAIELEKSSGKFNMQKMYTLMSRMCELITAPVAAPQVVAEAPQPVASPAVVEAPAPAPVPEEPPVPVQTPLKRTASSKLA
jgi:hypothetical protein